MGNEKEIKEMNYPIKISNEMIQKTQYELSAREYDITRFLIMSIKDDDTEIKPVTIGLRRFCELAGVNPNNTNNYTYIKKVILRLSKRMAFAPYIKQNGNNAEKLVYWIEPSSIEIDKTAGTVTLQLAKLWEPYLLDLKKLYLTTSMEEVLPMKSVYGKKLYELLKSHINNDEKSYRWYYEIEEFRAFMLGPEAAKKKYRNFADFRKKVLEPAMADLKNHGRVSASYELEKKGRTYSRIVFHFKTKDVGERLENYINSKEEEVISETPAVETEIASDIIYDPDDDKGVSMVKEEELFSEYDTSEEKTVVSLTDFDWVILDEGKVIAILESYKNWDPDTAKSRLKRLLKYDTLPDHYVISDRGEETFSKVTEMETQGIRDYQMISTEEFEDRALLGALEKQKVIKKK